MLKIKCDINQQYFKTVDIKFVKSWKNWRFKGEINKESVNDIQIYAIRRWTHCLQSMQDRAIQSRTELRLNAEIQDQEQKLTDLKLRCEQQRTHLSKCGAANTIPNDGAVSPTLSQHWPISELVYCVLVESGRCNWLNEEPFVEFVARPTSIKR